MITAIIIEDELKARQGLIKMIHLLDFPIEIIAESSLVKESISLINDLKPELVFLDVQLEDGIGFDILSQLNNLDFKVIFTTAYNEYAIRAFKYSVIDYLLKPINPEELKEAMDRAVESIKSEKEHKELLVTLSENENLVEKKIVLNTTEQRFIIQTKDIIRLEADGAYTLFYTLKNKIIVSKNLKYYEDLLDNSFIRCHQSHLVNIQYIVSLNRNNTIELIDGNSIPVSVRKKPDLKKRLNNKRI